MFILILILILILMIVKKKQLKDNTYKIITAKFKHGGISVESYQPYQDYKTYIQEIIYEEMITLNIINLH